MSDPVTPPAAPGGDPPAPATKPADPPAPAAISLTNEQLKQRLDESKASGTKALLKELGFESPDAAKAALKTLKDLQTAQLTEAEKAAARIKELEPTAARAATLEGTLAKLVEGQFSRLPEAAQKAIDAVAQGNAEKRLELMTVLEASGGLAPATPAPKPAPATVTPSPAPAPANGVKSKFDEWQEHMKTSPLLGDLFYQNNARAIESSRPAS